MQYLLLIPSLTCFGIAGWLAYKEKEGWGWFIFAGILTVGLLEQILPK